MIGIQRKNTVKLSLACMLLIESFLSFYTFAVEVNPSPEAVKVDVLENLDHISTYKMDVVLENKYVSKGHEKLSSKSTTSLLYKRPDCLSVDSTLYSIVEDVYAYIYSTWDGKLQTVRHEIAIKGEAAPRFRTSDVIDVREAAVIDRPFCGITVGFPYELGLGYNLEYITLMKSFLEVYSLIEKKRSGNIIEYDTKVISPSIDANEQDRDPLKAGAEWEWYPSSLPVLRIDTKRNLITGYSTRGGNYTVEFKNIVTNIHIPAATFDFKARPGEKIADRTDYYRSINRPKQIEKIPVDPERRDWLRKQALALGSMVVTYGGDMKEHHKMGELHLAGLPLSELFGEGEIKQTIVVYKSGKVETEDIRQIIGEMRTASRVALRSTTEMSTNPDLMVVIEVDDGLPFCVGFDLDTGFGKIDSPAGRAYFRMKRSKKNTNQSKPIPQDALISFLSSMNFPSKWQEQNISTILGNSPVERVIVYHRTEGALSIDSAKDVIWKLPAGKQLLHPLNKKALSIFSLEALMFLANGEVFDVKFVGNKIYIKNHYGIGSISR